ncbi:hypothetical protein [Halostella litorea]|uniref:hypothetical protein n=1 Tax=Halostella litorea TaxID=2528831 RepID=UPI001092FDD2|nr:hypothetical protein [Halostella litorea]
MSNETDLLAVKSDGEYAMDELSANHRRTARAVTESMIVVPHATDDGTATTIYHVYSASQSQYTVDLGNATCDCPDARRRDPDNGCKHVRRVRMLMAGDDSSFPAPGDDVRAYVADLRDLLDTLDARRRVLETAIRTARDDDRREVAQRRRDEYDTYDYLRQSVAADPLLADD